MGYERELEDLVYFNVDMVVVDEGFWEDFFCVFGNDLMWDDVLFSIFRMMGIQIDCFAFCVGTVFGYTSATVCKAQPTSQAVIVSFGTIPR